ncbi:MAG: aromatic ring-hydroxylating dioxygenase subunit alpha [Porticoccaceae bacterium]|jgi:p-cumate 2,3-dioxygenase alpha subunit|nr:aromatic ring-hydroxylating dioxygenase subunit alpha [Porticoccaceae bacterium]
MTIDDLIIDDAEDRRFRVERSVFTKQQILDEEKENIFNRCWLYAGHESELPEPETFLARKIANKPIILTRAKDGEIRAFLNACTHRGNLVCREKAGKGKLLRCFYHSWAFNLEGELAALPGPEAYSGSWKKEDMGLTPVPRVESYRGLIFICHDENVEPLAEYLGDVTEYIDLMLDFTDAESEIAKGEQNYCIGANWKLLVENSFDSYHGLPTHGRYFGKFLNDVKLDSGSWSELNDGDSLGGRSYAFKNGHALTENPARPTPLQIRSQEELADIKKRLTAKYGEERANRITGFNRNIFIFPNLFLIAYWRTIRTFYPVSPDYMEINAWCLLPTNDSPQLKQNRLENFISFLGPAGFGTPDDVAALEGCQKGFAATNRDPGWSDISRGMGKDIADSTDERQMRTFWREWQRRMATQETPVDILDNSDAKK